MDFLFVIALTVFIVSFLTMVFEFYDKAIVAMGGALLMIIFRVLDFEEAIHSIDFETIVLLMGMMILVDLASDSGVFSWLNVKITKVTRGRPWMIYGLFAVLTMVFSAFLDNVTTMLIIIPIIVSLTKGMGLNSRFFVISLILFSNIGGALTLIGDPPNIIIGSAAKLTFNDFIINLSVPIFAVAVVLGSLLAALNWCSLRPICGNLRKLFVTHLLIEKIEQKFVQIKLEKSFVTSVLSILCLTLLGFVFQSVLNFPVSVIAVTGAIALLVITTKHSSVHESFAKIEWPTLFFFIGLFIMVHGLEKVGLLDMISHGIIGFTDDYLTLLLMILWLSGIVSMLLDNIPFVTVMIPVIFQIQATLPGTVDPTMLWWALSLGACLGGCGTPIGASANVVSLGLAKKAGVKIGFLEYMKYGLPLTIVALSICSVYFWIVI
ncbi:MAG: ArsB/NhaD family transporter [Candidatus Gracilibacteria bacterium]|nr:ArsB/NhaD family transporter [Candidatus Gracilibacteria bacterium]